MAPTAQIEAAGGLDYGGIGTSFTKISQAIDKVYSEDGVAVLMDMGSAVMTTEMVMEDMPDRKIKMFECPLVEGAVVAAVESLACNSLDELAERAAAAGAMVVVVAAAFTGGGDLTKSIQDTLKDAANVIKPAAKPGA